MITLRQLEALYWIVQLGTFERAAAKLNTTQSAISKRIQELEAACHITVFDRDRRGAKLTEKGERRCRRGGCGSASPSYRH
jgi:DNA-binding transcriptional LysR family regulator